MNNLARKTDPISSHEAANDLKASGAQLLQQKECLLLLAKYGQGTRAEIAKKYADNEHEKCKGAFLETKAKLGRRLPELARNGLVTMVEIRHCEIAKKSCQAWECTAIGAAAAAAVAIDEVNDGKP
jgi:hypothetical protein